MSYDTQPTLGRRVGRSILWILSTALITFVLIILIVGLIWGAFLGFAELRRSFSAITTRNNVNEQRITLLRSDVDNLMADSRRVNRLESEVGDLEARLEQVQATLAADLRRQQEMLTVLEEDTATALNNSAAVAEDTATLGAGLSALQGDISDNSQRLDELGGELDQLRTELGGLDSGFAALQATVAARAEDEITETRQILALFHVWELISRARLRLLEDNFGLARADTEQALRALDALLATAPEAEVETWQRIQTRLELALANLPADPAMAAADLESAWDALDSVLTARLLPEVDAAGLSSEETDGTPTGEATTPTPAATSSPTPEATLAPTATP